MRIKRTALKIMVFAACTTLSAVSLDEVVSSAMATSPQYRNIEISYQNGLLSLDEMNLKDKTSVTVQAQVDPLAKSVSGVGAKLGDGEYGISISPAVSVTLPNGKTKLQGAASYSMDYKGNYSVISPSLGASHTFDFSGYDQDYIDDLSYAMQDISLNLSYASSTYSFRKSVISTISQLISMESSIKSSRNSLEKSEKSLSDTVALGTISTESATYKNQMYLIETSRDSLKSLEAQFENAKANYKTLTGLAWEGIDVLEKPVLELNILENGNSSVYLKALDVEVAEANYNSQYARLNPEALSIGATVSGGYLSDNVKTAGFDMSSGSLSISGNAAYTASNWSLSAKPGVSISFPNNGDAKATPSLSISGSWTNATAGESQDIALSKLKNSIVTAENNYINALSNYLQEGQSLSLRIMQWEYKCSQHESEMDYLEAQYNTQKELYELGLVAEEKVKDALWKLDEARGDWNVLMLEGESLKCDLAVYAL